MLFLEEDAPHLKKWIVKRIENTSDADADVLADYVLALLKHDGDISDVRKLCETEIPDFLKEDAIPFVNDLFETVAYKSYLPGAPPPPSKRAPPAPNFTLPPLATAPGELSYDDVPNAPTPQIAGLQRGGRKRGWNDRGEADGPQGQVEDRGKQGRRGIKQPRRGRGGRHDDVAGAGYNTTGFSDATGQMPYFPRVLSGHFDAMGALMGMGQLAFTGNTFAAPAPLGRRRQRCRDYDTKGYCARGNTCMFQHGDEPVYPPPSGPFGAQKVPHPQNVEEYDPANALLAASMFGAPNLLLPQPFLPDKKQQGRGRTGQKRRTKAPFSSDGPNFDKAKTTVVVESIPEENFTEDQVREFFSQFGNIVEVSMQPYKRLAIVKYDNWASANAAYQSPKVIFENRFVKVFWFKDEDLSQPLGPTSKKGGSVVDSVETDSPGALTGPELEEFLRKQGEAQRLHEEKMKKLQDLERQKQEVEKQRQELATKQREAQALLDAKLAKIGTTNGEHSDNGKPTKPLSEALRDQLAALEAEAKQLGIDPHASGEPPAWNPPGGYGRGRGRGGYFRGRGVDIRGGFRGAFRGRGGHHAAYAAYSLDNRPKKVRLTGVDFTASNNGETLREYLLGIGEFTDVETNSINAEITFMDRKTAEKFFHGVQLSGKTIPGIQGEVEPLWVGNDGNSIPPTPMNGTPGGSGVNTPARNPGAQINTNQPASFARQQAAQQAKQQLPRSAEDGGESVSSDKDVHIMLERPANTDMDYEVADEDQWDME